MTKLSVNINKIALLRNQRNIDIPSVIWAAKTAIEAGAYGITVHPRPDQRHIRYSDVYDIKKLIDSHPDIEFNIEGNPFQGRYMEIVSQVRPTQATLVPDLPGANTSDHGWNLLDNANTKKLMPIITQLKDWGIRTSLFVDPVIETVHAAKEMSTDRIELYTEPFAAAFSKNENLSQVTEKYSAAAKIASQLEIGINAGHDLNLDNLEFFCDHVKGVLEVSIGHALIADALKIGLSQAVKQYLKILSK